MSRIPKHAKKVFDGVLFSVHQWEQELFDGSSTTFEMLERPDTAIVVPVLKDKRIMLVQDTQPHFGTTLTLPGGRIEHGEEPLLAAQRELVEETGYTSTDWELWYSYDPTRKLDWTIYIYIARGCIKTTEPSLDAGEQVELESFSFEEFLALGQSEKYQASECTIDMLKAQLDPAYKEELRKKFYT